jgi:tetratricopeptide (TPR) repeat protein
LHQIAKLYLHEGFVGNAKIYYQNILEINPHDSETLEALRNIETQQQPKKIEPTIPFREPPLPPHRPPFRGETAEEKSNQPPSLTMPSIALSSKPEPFPSDGDFEVHYHLGIAYKEMELYDQAISEFELASADLSKTFDCDIMIGSCYMDKGDYNKSIEYYKMASEIREISTKRLAWLQFHLGLAYEASEMFPEALKAFELVLEMDPTFSRVEEKIKKLKDFSK